MMNRGRRGRGAAYKCISLKGCPNNALIQCALDMITGNHPVITFCTSKTHEALRLPPSFKSHPLCRFYRLPPFSLFPFPSLSRRSLNHATTFFHPLRRAFNRAWARPLTRRSQDDLSKLSHFAVHFAPRDVFAEYLWYSSTIRKIRREIEFYNNTRFFSFIIAILLN